MPEKLKCARQAPWMMLFLLSFLTKQSKEIFAKRIWLLQSEQRKQIRSAQNLLCCSGEVIYARVLLCLSALHLCLNKSLAVPKIAAVMHWDQPGS
ncbi:hypothetical protein RRG08_047940 [Elysia crispata]|uniref:Secreted protein n=1 Tax=Elysia crispata TaxID=231223 RepID=A0AAE1DI78_9GAST|nr:hypothetical protein RRG08_047940 [Elysia crispata]